MLPHIIFGLVLIGYLLGLRLWCAYQSGRLWLKVCQRYTNMSHHEVAIRSAALDIAENALSNYRKVSQRGVVLLAVGVLPHV